MVTELRFGTDGWRGIIADDYTFANVRVVAAAIADYILREANISPLTSHISPPKSHLPPLAIGYDARFLSEDFARAAAEVLAAKGIPIVMASQICPTPALSFAIKDQQLAGGIMITASHNPPKFNGVKFKTWHAGSAGEEITRQFEERAKQILALGRSPEKLPLDQAEREGLLRWFDPKERYLDALLSFVDVEAIRRAQPRVVVDVMHGAASGFMDEVLQRAGCQIEVLRAEWNPGFGGTNPEPMEENLEPFLRAVRSEGMRIGIATDGDGDRIAGATETGEYINTHQTFALTLMHLVEDRGLRGGVAKALSSTSMIDLLAERYGLKLFETPVGFKHICNLMLKEDILIGGEESGGIGIRGHLPERDASLCALLLVAMIVQRGVTASQLISQLWERVGEHHYRRHDLPIERGAGSKVNRALLSLRPERLLDRKVERIQTTDGIKFFLEGGAWLLLRPSNTEPVVRVYAEAGSHIIVDRLIEEGHEMVQKALQRNL